MLSTRCLMIVITTTMVNKTSSKRLVRDLKAEVKTPSINWETTKRPIMMMLRMMTTKWRLRVNLTLRIHLETRLSLGRTNLRLCRQTSHLRSSNKTHRWIRMPKIGTVSMPVGERDTGDRSLNISKGQGYPPLRVANESKLTIQLQRICLIQGPWVALNLRILLQVLSKALIIMLRLTSTSKSPRQPANLFEIQIQPSHLSKSNSQSFS